MPKCKQNDLVKRLIAAEGHLMTLQGLCRATGYKSPKSARAWAAAGIRQYKINGRLRYDTTDVAAKIMEGQQS